MNIVEIVARAICKSANPNNEWDEFSAYNRMMWLDYARAAIAALAYNVTDAMLIAFSEEYTPTPQGASIDEVKEKLRRAIAAALRTGSGAGSSAKENNS